MNQVIAALIYLLYKREVISEDEYRIIKSQMYAEIGPIVKVIMEVADKD